MFECASRANTLALAMGRLSDTLFEETNKIRSVSLDIYEEKEAIYAGFSKYLEGGCESAKC